MDADPLAARHEAEPPGGASLRRRAFLVSALAATVLLIGALVLAVSAVGVMQVAERTRAEAGRELVDELRAVGAVERMIVLGDQLVGAARRDTWQAAGVAMQALAYHPSFSALPRGAEEARATYVLVDEILRLRHAEEATPDGAVSPARQETVFTRWQAHRPRLQRLADETAAGVIRRTSDMSDNAARSGRLMLALTVFGVVFGLLLIGGLLFLVRRHLLQPLLAFAQYASDLHLGVRDDTLLPRATHREVADVSGALRELAQAQESLRQMALYDPLTGLANRSALGARLDQALADARRQKSGVALLLIDLDAFKSINDTLGHDAGDEFLCEIANRIDTLVRETDTAARLGGDEFVVVLGGVAGAVAVAGLAERLQQEIARPARIGTHELSTTASIGISLYPGDGGDLGTLLKNADIAMYGAKARGRGNSLFFSAAMNASTQERHALEQALRAALDQEEFRLHFQPQIEAASGRVVALEALLRWPRTDGSMTPPDRFIPVAEETGLIGRLGIWVLQEACATLRAWLDAGLGEVRVAVNVSARQLADQSLVTQTRLALAASGIPPRLLELEVTESVAMQDPELTIGNLRALRALGVSLAIDDFGTGYSSLAYLKLFPLDRLKLDRGFVKDIESDANDAAICNATIRLAHSLSLTVVAEGVETEAQRAFLQAQGCDLLQGYLFARALPAPEALAFTLARNALASAARAPSAG